VYCSYDIHLCHNGLYTLDLVVFFCWRHLGILHSIYYAVDGRQFLSGEVGSEV
jgi:hypothetical protein